MSKFDLTITKQKNGMTTNCLFVHEVYRLFDSKMREQFGYKIVCLRIKVNNKSSACDLFVVFCFIKYDSSEVTKLYSLSFKLCMLLTREKILNKFNNNDQLQINFDRTIKLTQVTAKHQSIKLLFHCDLFQCQWVIATCRYLFMHIMHQISI